MEEAPQRPADVVETRERPKRSFLSELPVLIVVAFVLALILKTFLIQAFYIPSASMEPTLMIGDRVLVNKLGHAFRPPKRGEIVVFTVEGGVQVAPEHGNPVSRMLRGLASGLGMTPASERDFIKRVIGLPGDVIEMREGVVSVNGTDLPEAPHGEGGYLAERHLEPFGPFTVPPGHYFMMGDNRPNSSDSRYSLGPVAENRIVGRAFVIIWPLSSARLLGLPDYGQIPDPAAQAAAPAAEPARPAA